MTSLKVIRTHEIISALSRQPFDKGLQWAILDTAGSEGRDGAPVGRVITHHANGRPLYGYQGPAASKSRRLDS
jgi:hypothetical protein